MPRDVTVTGFDDIPFASMSVPSLTTVRMPVREMVAQAMRVAIDEPSDGSRGWRPAQHPGAGAGHPRLERPGRRIGGEASGMSTGMRPQVAPTRRAPRSRCGPSTRAR